MPCLHSFCKKCLEQKLEEQGSSAGSIKCPTCDTVSTLPSGGVASLPSNHWLAHQAEVSSYQKKIKDGADIPCGRCVEGTSGTAVAFCCSCCLFLCSLCQEDHRRYRETVSHELVTTGEKKTVMDTKVVPSCKPAMCVTHPKEELKFYCGTCKCLVCRDCIAMEHTSHARVYPESIAEREKELLSGKIKEAANAITKLETAVSTRENLKKLIEAQGNELNEKIVEEFKTIYTLIQEREKVLLNKSKRMTNHKLTMLSTEIEEMQTLKENLAFSSQIADDSQSLTPTHLLSTMKPIQEYLQNRLASFARQDLESGECDDISVAFDKPAIEKAVSNMGSVLGGCDPAKCTVEHGLAIPLATSNRWSNMEIKVGLRNSDGELVCKDVPLVANLESRNGYKRQATVRFLGDGHALLCVSPPVVGECDFIIKVKNRHIDLSPYKIWSRENSPHRKITSSSKQMFYVGGNAVGVAVHHNGDVYASHCGDSIQVFGSDGIVKLQFGSRGYADSLLYSPVGLTIIDEVLYVVDSGNHRVQKFTLTGEYLGQFGSHGSGEGQFNAPDGTCSDGSRHVLVADNRNNRVQVFTAEGKFVSKITCYQPHDLAVDNTGNIHVTSISNHCVKVYSPDGKELSTYGSGNRCSPAGIAVDEEGYRYVCDSHNSRICIFNPNGALVSDTIVCPSNPRCMTLDNRGNLYVACYNSNCVIKYKCTEDSL